MQQTEDVIKIRFIGNKKLLLKNIEEIIEENIENKKDIKTFCDIFSGTSIVARYFKPKYQIISNDMLFFSYVLQMATIHNNQKPRFIGLKKVGIQDPIGYLENADIYSNNFNDSMFFIYKNYSPNKNCNRMYFTHQNAKRIDFMRLTIEKWHNQKLINDNEYYYLIMCLLEGACLVSNTAGTYGAYLKHWDNEALKKVKLIKTDIINNNHKNQCFNKDANKLIREILGDILYLDPPYVKRQYAPNYHLLETIAKYDRPEIYGKTGLRPYNDKKSDYCKPKKVEKAFEELIINANFRYIIMSYSTDGLMTIEQIEKILKTYCNPKTYKVYKIPYKRYKSNNRQDNNKLNELIFYIEK